jgi:hypothetical protein
MYRLQRFVGPRSAPDGLSTGNRDDDCPDTAYPSTGKAASGDGVGTWRTSRGTSSTSRRSIRVQIDTGGSALPCEHNRGDCLRYCREKDALKEGCQ